MSPPQASQRLIVGALALAALAAFFVARRAGEAPAPETTRAPESARGPEAPEGIVRRCEPWPQSGCSAHQKCDMFCGAEGPELGCAPDEGTLTKGQPCDETVKSGPRSCAKGTVCLGLRDGTRCVAFCDGDAACGGGKCVTAKAFLSCPSGPRKPRPFVLHVCK